MLTKFYLNYLISSENFTPSFSGFDLAVEKRSFLVSNIKLYLIEIEKMGVREIKRKRERERESVREIQTDRCSHNDTSKRKLEEEQCRYAMYYTGG